MKDFAVTKPAANCCAQWTMATMIRPIRESMTSTVAAMTFDLVACDGVRPSFVTPSKGHLDRAVIALRPYFVEKCVNWMRFHDATGQGQTL